MPRLTRALPLTGLFLAGLLLRPDGAQAAPAALTAKAAPAGKLAASAAAKRLGKAPPVVSAGPAPQRAPSVALALPGKAAAPPPYVQAALGRLTAASTEPPRLRLDPHRGALRRFSGRVPNPHGRGPEAAARLLQDHRDVLGLAALAGDVELVPRRVIDDPADGVHIYYGVSYRGLPVWGAELAIHLDAAGDLTALNAQDLGPIRPAHTLRYGPDAARQRARPANARDDRDGRVIDHGEPELGVWPGGPAREASLAWRFVQEVTRADGAPQRYATYVDAGTGQLLARLPQIITAKPQPQTTNAADLYGEQVPLRITFYPDTNSYALIDQSKGAAGATLYTHDAAYTSSYGAVVTSNKKSTWPASAVTAHHHLQKVIDYFATTHGRNSWDGQGAQVRTTVHYGQQYNNAFWDAFNKVMVFGEGDGKLFHEFTRALDVAGHEYSHAVVTGTVPLEYYGQSGALNESFADVMAVMIDRDDWTIGEDIVGPKFPGAFARSLADPAAGNQPAHMSALYKGLDDYGGVHINSGIPNRAAYLLGTKRSREAVERIWYRTLYSAHVTSKASFIDMAEGTMAACDELKALGKATAADCVANAEAWVAVGVLGSAAVPMDGCPPNASEQGGLCYCDPGYYPAEGGATCVAYDAIQCPVNSIPAMGTCYCKDGFVPNSDFSQCVAKESGCPLNSTWDPAIKACACKEGFEGVPNAADGKCDPVDSDCPPKSHPEWPDPDLPDQYICACNDNFEYDGQNCVIIPGTCGDESFYGRCDGDDLIYCKQSGDPDDGVQQIQCGQGGLVCGLFDSLIGQDCLNPDGVAPAGACEAAGYQECDDSAPFCVAEADAEQGFCSHECKTKAGCGGAFDCCATVSDGTRACLIDPYCAENIDPKATCDDVPGGSTFYGKCVGDVLVYCDGSSDRTQEVFCAVLGQECGWVDAGTGYSCVPPNSGALPSAPADYCPYDHDGVCDAPGLCPEGSDLYDCNPCGDVTEAGLCAGDLLKICDPGVGLITTDCAALPLTPECGPTGDGALACVPGGGGGESGGVVTAGDDSGDSGGDGGDDATAGQGGGGSTLTCTCRSQDPSPGHLALLLLSLAALRRRRSP
jgi:bacillolysin